MNSNCLLTMCLNHMSIYKVFIICGHLKYLLLFKIFVCYCKPVLMYFVLPMSIVLEIKKCDIIKQIFVNITN